MNIVISVQEDARGTKKENWKDPFKKLKFSSIRAEKKWVILLAVHEREVKKIYKLCGSSLHVETVVEDAEHVSWEDKTAQFR